MRNEDPPVVTPASVPGNDVVVGNTPETRPQYEWAEYNLPHELIRHLHADIDIVMCATEGKEDTPIQTSLAASLAA